MGKKVLFSLADENQTKSFRDKFENRLVAFSQYELQKLDFSDYSGIILTLYSDQYLLKKLGKKFESFLENGGKLFINGHIFKPFLKELSVFEPVENIKLPDFMVTQLSKHEIYININTKKLSKRKGVAGFFSRGSNPPPNGAKHIMAIKNSTVIADWECEVGRGKLYVHSGNDLWACMEQKDDNLQIFENILNYLGEKNEKNSSTR